MDKTEKKALKQFALVDNTSCIIYLQRIIATSVLCLDAMKRFNKQTADILAEANEKMNTKIPYDIYSDILHKTSNSMCYLLNVLGDAQTSSVSYFKYRKQVEKLVKTKLKELHINHSQLNLKKFVQTSINCEFGKIIFRNHY